MATRFANCCNADPTVTDSPQSVSDSIEAQKSLCKVIPVHSAASPAAVGLANQTWAGLVLCMNTIVAQPPWPFVAVK